MTCSDATVLKVDKTGRVWTPASRREALLDEFDRSGMSAVGFAKAMGVKYPTFMSWIQKRRDLASTEKSAVDCGQPPAMRHGPPPFLEAVLDADALRGRPAAPLKITLPGGVTLEIHDPTQIGLATALIQRLNGIAVAC